MCCRSGVEAAICIAPSIGGHWRSNPTCSRCISVLCCSIFDAVVRQWVSLTCLCVASSAVKVAGMSATLCFLSNSMFVASSGIAASLTLSTKRTTMSVKSDVSIAESGRSYLGGAAVVLLVSNLESHRWLGVLCQRSGPGKVKLE